MKQLRLDAAKGITFTECAEQLIESKKAEWKNAKHTQQWTNTLTTYAHPVIGDLSIADVDTNLVLQILEPIWRTKTETATRLRQRIEAVIDWATVREYRTGVNPAVWRGHLDKLLPKPSKIAKVKHQPALPYHDINQFITELRKREGIAPRAVELCILTSTRSNEIRFAQWAEFNLKNNVWIIPGDRMKSGREHRVPLSDQAINLINALPVLGDYLFTGQRSSKPFSDSAMRQVLMRMKRTDITVHGFRSTFRDWCAEQTNYPREVAESALAHVLSDKTEAAYQRGDLLEKRRKLMQSWADFIDQNNEKAKVIQINQKST